VTTIQHLVMIELIKKSRKLVINVEDIEDRVINASQKLTKYLLEKRNSKKQVKEN
jgi:hypothetical protein